jgi:hypothetical protein
MEKNRINIYIAHTPFQNYVVSRIAKQYGSDPDVSNILFTSSFAVSSADFDKTFFLGKGNIGFRITALSKARRRIARYLSIRNAQLFIPHTSALLDNYFFYTYPKKKRGFGINLYYEGILYFYPYHEPYRWKMHLPRSILGFILSMPYKRTSLICPVEDKSVQYIYTILPEFTLGPSAKFKQVTLEEPHYTPNPSRILILGGKPSLLTNTEVIELYKRMLQRIKNLNRPVEVLFKGHHADLSDNFLKANQNSVPFKDITQAMPVEQIISEVSPTLILSYPSSGLVNLKAMFGAKIEMACYYIENKQQHIERLIPIFGQLGIEITLIRDQE